MAEATSKAEYFVGVDLGGTKILSGVFKSSHECIGTAKLSTKSQRGVEAVIERIARCVQDAVDESDLSLKQVAGVGIGAPGAVDFAAGTVIFAPNLEGWKDVPLKTHGCNIHKTAPWGIASSPTISSSAGAGICVLRLKIGRRQPIHH